MHLRHLLPPRAALGLLPVLLAGCLSTRMRWAATEPTPIAAGAVVTDTLLSVETTRSTRYRAFYYRAAAGERATVTVRSPDFDALVAIEGPVAAREQRGPEITRDDDGAPEGTTDARAAVIFPTAGLYIIRASSVANTGGRFSVAVFPTGASEPRAPGYASTRRVQRQAPQPAVTVGGFDGAVADFRRQMLGEGWTVAYESLHRISTTEPERVRITPWNPAHQLLMAIVTEQAEPCREPVFSARGDVRRDGAWREGDARNVPGQSQRLAPGVCIALATFRTGDQPPVPDADLAVQWWAQARPVRLTNGAVFVFRR